MRAAWLCMVLPVMGAITVSCHAAIQLPPDTPSLSSVTFDTDGGKTWSFTKRVTGRVRGGDCEEIIINSAKGHVRALPRQERFAAEVTLHSGPNRLSASCIEAGQPRGRPAVQWWDVRAADLPRAWIRTRVIGNDVELDASGSTAAAGSASPLKRFEWRAGGGNPAPLAPTPRSGPRIQFPVPAVDGTYFVTVQVTDALGRSDRSTTEFQVVQSRPVVINTRSQHPLWLDDAVVYGLSPEFLAGRDFAAVCARLDEILQLGATVLWLSPVTEAPGSDFGYGVTDPFQLRHAFGTEQQFRALLSAAHGRGLRVMLDMVTNHLARQSPYFADTVRRGRQSAYYTWFERDSTGQPLHYFDWGDLMNLNYANPEVRDFMAAALTHWIRDYPVDALRLDAIWALRERAPRVLSQLRQELERVNPDIAVLAEASALDSYYTQQGFAAAYDWTLRLGQWAWQDVFGAPGTTANVPRLREALRAEWAREPRTLKVFHFLNNNDTGARFITRHGLPQTRLAAVLLFTLPGLPLVYAGDEVGAEFEPYHITALPDWHDPYALRPLYQHMIRLRQRQEALRSASMTLVPTDQDDRVLAFAREPEPEPRRSDDPAHDTWLVVLNFSASPVKVRLMPPEALRAAAARPWSVLDPLADAHSATIASAHSPLELPGYGAVLLHQALVLRALRLGRHDTDGTNIATLVRARHGRVAAPHLAARPLRRPN